jgi:glutaminase
MLLYLLPSTLNKYLCSAKKEKTMNYGTVIEKIYNDIRTEKTTGNVADYIPALAEINPNNFAIAVETLNGCSYGVGDKEVKFSIQSISKVFTLAMLAGRIGQQLWEFVGREPSGTPFNSLVQLEREEGIPRNPFMNAGALVITDRLMDYFGNTKEEILNYIRVLCNNQNINYNERIALSEIDNADRNMALAYFMKSFGNIKHDVNTLIDIYCHQCSIEMSASDLAKSFLFLANHGINIYNNERLLTASQSKRLGALMLTCGLYDESGDYAFRTGMPGKSGVGGGIVAYIPGNLAIAVWSPALNDRGNSIRGIEVLERFTTDIGNSIF